MLSLDFGTEAMMDRRKRWGALVALLAAPSGTAIARLHLIAPSPGMFFVLGILATLCVLGVVYGVREGRKLARTGKTIGG